MTQLPLAVVGVGAALLGGGLIGYLAGMRVRGRLRTYWTLSVAAVVGCAALDFAAMSTGRHVLGYSAIGLMGGLITGLKYGYTDLLRVWPEPEPAEPPEGESADEPVEKPLDAENADVDSAR